VNAHGEVIGINTFLISPSGSFAGMGFAIPTQIARPVVDTLLKDGKIEHARIGVGINDVTPENASFFHLDNASGALISQVEPDSPASKAGIKVGDVITELNGKKIGITSAGSGTDILARWTQADRKVEFTRVPLGGGGLVPNLLSGNIDGCVLYSPLTYKMFIDKTARSLIDFGAAVEPHLTGAWIATDKFIKEKPQTVQKTLNALYGGLLWLQNPAHRADAVKMIAEIDEIPPNIAEAELDNNIIKLSKTGEIKNDWMSRALDMGRLIGMTDLASPEESYITSFRPVPTA